ncbi:MAG TPA: hypothetical protein VFR68_03000, partial [Candidatus Dormibacteraeota bacterium]|nr:hypothetical protein [Candidatus Dormibacteraeota bacterium]
MTAAAIANRKAVLGFALWVAAILLGLAILTAIIGIAVKTWAPGFDTGTLQAIAAHRSQPLTRVASIVSNAGSFALLAPLAAA